MPFLGLAFEADLLGGGGPGDGATPGVELRIVGAVEAGPSEDRVGVGVGVVISAVAGGGTTAALSEAFGVAVDSGSVAVPACGVTEGLGANSGALS